MYVIQITSKAPLTLSLMVHIFGQIATILKFLYERVNLTA